MPTKPGPVTTLVVDKLTQPLQNVFMWSAIIAGVFFLIAILLLVALFTQQSTFSKIMTIVVFIVMLAQAIAATIFAVYVDNLTRKINNTFASLTRKASAAIFGGKLINALLGKRAVNEDTGEPLAEEQTKTDVPAAKDSSAPAEKK